MFVFVCITTAQPVAKDNPNANRNATSKQHAVVSFQLNMVTCPAYPEKFIRDNVNALFLLLSVAVEPQSIVNGLSI